MCDRISSSITSLEGVVELLGDVGSGVTVFKFSEGTTKSKSTIPLQSQYDLVNV
jgi:hypothetical protein